MMGSRRGFFFSLDVLLFLFIITFGAVLVLSSLPARSARAQPLTLADSLATFLATTQVRDVESYASGLPYKTLDHTILDQALVFMMTDGGKEYAKDLVGGVINGAGLVPSTYSVRVTLKDEVLYEVSGRLEDDSDFLIATTRIVYFYDKPSGKVIGPYTAQVMIWRGD